MIISLYLIQINVASLSAYCVTACKIKHFTERKFSGIFSLALIQGHRNSRFENTKSPRQSKNFRKFPFAKMLDFARSNTISTQIIATFIWSNYVVKATGNSRFENAKFPPRQRKNSRKFPFGKMLQFTRSNRISTQTSNNYMNQLQWWY